MIALTRLLATSLKWPIFPISDGVVLRDRQETVHCDGGAEQVTDELALVLVAILTMRQVQRIPQVQRVGGGAINGRGIGGELVRLVRENFGLDTRLMRFAARAAASVYSHVGFGKCGAAKSGFLVANLH